MGLLVGVFLSEYATGPLRRILKPCLELLAGIPSVVFGYVALYLVTPLLQVPFPHISPSNAAA
ncbi:phosphate ABC transporter permease subunit PstC, partial [Acinetobacter baumannii]